MYRETQEALQQKRDYKVDFRIVLPDGTVKYLEAIGHHLFSEHGELVQVVGTNVDTVPALLWSSAPDGELTDVNQRILEEYFGVRFEDLQHRGWADLVHPDDLSQTANAFQHAIQ